VPQLVPADKRTIPPNLYIPQSVPATGRTIQPNPSVSQTVPATVGTIQPNSYVSQTVPATVTTIPLNPYVPQTVSGTVRAIPPNLYIPHSVPAADGLIPLSQVPVSSSPIQTTLVNRLLPRTYTERSTILPAVKNSVGSHGNGSAVAGCSLGYSERSVSIHSYPPNQHGSSSFNTPNTLYSHNLTTQQCTSTQRNNDIHQNANPRVTHPNGSTQVGRKSASHSFIQPYSQNTTGQQNILSQAVRNSGPHTSTATDFSQQYPQNSVQQGTYLHVNNVFPVASASDSSSYAYSRSGTVQQGTFSQSVSSTLSDMSTYNCSSRSYANNVAGPGRAPNSFGYLNQQNQASTYHLSNDFPVSSLTGRAQNVSWNAGPTREIYGYAPQTRNRFHSSSSYPTQLPTYPQNLRQMLQQAEQQVNVVRENRGDEHHAYVGQANGGACHRVSCGLPQQQQTPPVVSDSELQSCGTPQSVSNRRRSYGKENANITASNNFCDGRNTQNVPASGISYRGNNQSRYFGYSTASNSLSGTGNNSEGLSLASTAASDRLSDRGSAQIEPAVNTLSDKRNSEGLSLASNVASDRLSDGGTAQIEPASSSMAVKQNSEGLSLASTAASDRMCDGSAQIERASSSMSRRENTCVSVANSRATSSLSDTGNNQRSGFAANSTTNNGVFDSGSNKTPPFASTTINDSVCDRGNSRSGSLNSAAGDGLSRGGNIHSGPPPVVDIPSLIPLQSRLKDINQQSNRLTEKMPACDAGKHIMNSVNQDDMSVATTTPSTEIRSIDINNGLIESYSIPEAIPVQNPQLEMHSNITICSISQTLSHGIQHSSQQRHLSDTVTTQPVLTNSTPVVTVQASENQDNVPGVLRQENGMPSTIHSVQKTLNLQDCELLNAHHVTHIAAESEPPEKTVRDDESTRDKLRTGRHDTVIVQTCRKKTSDAKSRNQSKRIEVFGHTNDAQVGAEVGGVQDTSTVENAVGRQDKCGVESTIPQKCSSPSYLSDPGTGVGSDVAGEGGNSSSAKVMSRLLEEREVTVLADFVHVQMTEEATGTENNRDHEPEIEVVSSMLV